MDRISDLAYNPIDEANEDERQEKVANAVKNLRGVLKEHPSIKNWINKIKQEAKSHDEHDRQA